MANREKELYTLRSNISTMKNLNHHCYNSTVILLLSFSVHSCQQSHLHVQDGETLRNKTDQETPAVGGTLSTPIKNPASLEHSESNMGIENNEEMPDSGTASRLLSQKRSADALRHDPEEKKESPTALGPSTTYAPSTAPIQNITQRPHQSDAMTVLSAHTVARLTTTEQQDAEMVKIDTNEETRDAEDSEISKDLEHWFQKFVEAVDDEEVLYEGSISTAIPRLVQEGKEKGYLTKSIKLPIEVGWESYCTPLHYAAAKGNSQAVDALLKEPNVAIDAQTQEIGTTPLQFAAHGGHLESARLLIESYKEKGKMEKIDTKDKQNTSTLQYASLGIQEDRNREVAELLVKEGADPCQIDSEGISLMDMAAVAGNSAMIEFCLEKVFDHKDKKSIIRSAIKQAKRKGHTHIVVMLQSRYEVLTET